MSWYMVLYSLHLLCFVFVFIFMYHLIEIISISMVFHHRDTQTSSTNSANTKKRNGTTNDDVAVHPPSPVLTVGKAVAPTSTVKSVSDKDRMKQHERISEVV